MLQQACVHLPSDDCSRALYALECARVAQDFGHGEAALSELEQIYENVKYCDEDTRLLVIDIALEIAWEWFLAGKWVDAKVWFSKAWQMVSNLPIQSCMLLAAISHSGVAAAQLQAAPHHDELDQHGGLVTKLMADAEQCLQQFAWKSANGCQIAHLYLAICCTLVGSQQGSTAL